MNAKRNLRYDRATHDLLWGAPQESIQEALQKIPLTPLAVDRITSIRRVVERATERSIENLDEWEYRLRLGKSYHDYLRFLDKLKGTDDAKNDTQLAKLINHKQRLIEASDMRPITDVLESGRSVVLLELHAGYRRAINTNLKNLDWPLSFIGNGSRMKTAIRDDEFNVQTNQSRTNFDFAHLCKLMRKTVRVARILADGTQGQSMRKTEIGGINITIGLGAAQLAYIGKAAFVFGRSCWTDTGVKSEFFPGPVVENADSKETVEEKLVSFYRASTIDLLAGDPINFGLRGGYWKYFSGLKK